MAFDVGIFTHLFAYLRPMINVPTSTNTRTRCYKTTCYFTWLWPCPCTFYSWLGTAGTQQWMKSRPVILIAPRMLSFNYKLRSRCENSTHNICFCFQLSFCSVIVDLSVSSRVNVNLGWRLTSKSTQRKSILLTLTGQSLLHGSQNGAIAMRKFSSCRLHLSWRDRKSVV